MGNILLVAAGDVSPQALAIWIGAALLPFAVLGFYMAFLRPLRTRRLGVPCECRKCGKTDQNPDVIPSGTAFAEFLLWCCLIVPGAMYRRWRRKNLVIWCPFCHRRNTMAPVVSARLKEIIRRGSTSSPLR